MDTILITGANRGLGLEFARQYLAEGWRVLACCRQPSAALQACAGQRGELQIHALDVADHAAIEGLADELRGVPIDVLLNNAGYFGPYSFDREGIAHQSFGRSDYADWDKIFRVNVMGPMKMAECFVTHVAASRQKKIITLSSMVGSMALNSFGGLYPYRASKAAVNAIMKSMAIDLREQGILALAMHPGWARTDMGGPNASVDPVEAVAGVRRVIANLVADQLGVVIAWDGEVLPY